MSVPLHHRLLGPPDAPPLLLGSSLGTTAAMWEPQLRELATRLRVVAFDHRGHGASPVPAGPYALADLGADVLALADAVGAERFRYAGLSLGGMVGMWLGANAPERVERLALLSTSAWMSPASAWLERAATVRSAGAGAVAEAVVGRWFTPGFAERHPEVVAGYRAGVAATPAEGYAACCEAIAAMDLRDDLARVVAPTLVVAGEQDSSTPPERARDIAARIAGARLVVLADAAHLLNVQQPAAVTGLLLDHLADER